MTMFELVAQKSPRFALVLQGATTAVAAAPTTAAVQEVATKAPAPAAAADNDDDDDDDDDEDVDLFGEMTPVRFAGPRLASASVLNQSLADAL